jgi:hypothetical protein
MFILKGWDMPAPDRGLLSQPFRLKKDVRPLYPATWKHDVGDCFVAVLLAGAHRHTF